MNISLIFSNLRLEMNISIGLSNLFKVGETDTDVDLRLELERPILMFILILERSLLLRPLHPYNYVNTRACISQALVHVRGSD